MCFGNIIQQTDRIAVPRLRRRLHTVVGEGEEITQIDKVDSTKNGSKSIKYRFDYSFEFKVKTGTENALDSIGLKPLLCMSFYYNYY